MLDQLATYAGVGAVRPVVDRAYPLEEIAAAHTALESGGVHAKIVVHI